MNPKVSSKYKRLIKASILKASNKWWFRNSNEVDVAEILEHRLRWANAIVKCEHCDDGSLDLVITFRLPKTDVIVDLPAKIGFGIPNL